MRLASLLGAILLGLISGVASLEEIDTLVEAQSAPATKASTGSLLEQAVQLAHRHSLPAAKFLERNLRTDLRKRKLRGEASSQGGRVSLLQESEDGLLDRSPSYRGGEAHLGHMIGESVKAKLATASYSSGGFEWNKQRKLI